MIGISDFAEEAKVGEQHDTRVQEVIAGEGLAAENMFHQQSNGSLALHIGPLVDGSDDRTLFEIRDHP